MSDPTERLVQQLMQMFAQQNEQNRVAMAQSQAVMAAIAQNQVAMQAMAEAMQKTASLDNSRIDTSTTSPVVSQTQLMNEIGSRIAIFHFDPESNKTFPKWFARYESAFSVEGNDLDNENKVSLIVSKLSDDVYDQYSKRICPKKHTEIKFDETIKTLGQMFDVKKSLFSHRFACMNIARDGENPVEYTGKVNSLCETAMLNDIDAEGWKVFFWLKGLDASKDTQARAYFLKYVEQKWERKEPITVHDLCEEWQKLLRQNSVISEMEQSEKTVKSIHGKHGQYKHKSPTKRAPTKDNDKTCQNCGRKGHIKTDCRFPLTKCFNCQRDGHMSKFCRFNNYNGSQKAQSVSVIANAISCDKEVNNVRRYITVDVMNQKIDFQLDTASDITLISRKDWMKIGMPRLEQCPIKVKSASGNEVRLLGRAKVNITLKGSERSEYVHVSREHGNLLGLDWISTSPEMSYHMNMMVNQVRKKAVPVFRPKRPKLVARCNSCQIQVKTLTKDPLEPWKTPERVWQRVHIDYAGPENGQYYLVVVDALSKWAEVSIVKSISATSTVRTLKAIFSSQGYPETLVSDNGTQFVSKEFADMCSEFGIEHIRSPAFHPQSNGQAERFVDTLKRGLKKLKGEGSVDNEIMSKFLLHYRSTPSNALGGLTPAKVHLGRELRTRMSLMIPRPNLKRESKSPMSSNMKEQFDKYHGTKQKTYSVQDMVYTKVYDKNVWSWIPAVITKRTGRVVYVVLLNDGRERTVHANQLKRRESDYNKWMDTMFDIFEIPMPEDNEIKTNTSSLPVHQSPPSSPPVQVQPASSSSGPPQPQPGVTASVRRGTRNRRPVDRYDASSF